MIERVFKALLWLFPADFRQRFADELLAMGGLRRLILVVGAVERDGGGHHRRFSFASFRVGGGASCGGEHQHPDCKAAHRHLSLGMDVHKESITIAVLPAGAKTPTRIERLPNELPKLKRFLDRLAARCAGDCAARQPSPGCHGRPCTGETAYPGSNLGYGSRAVPSLRYSAMSTLAFTAGSKNRRRVSM